MLRKSFLNLTYTNHLAQTKTTRKQTWLNFRYILYVHMYSCTYSLFVAIIVLLFVGTKQVVEKRCEVWGKREA